MLNLMSDDGIYYIAWIISVTHRLVFFFEFVPMTIYIYIYSYIHTQLGWKTSRNKSCIETGE